MKIRTLIGLAALTALVTGCPSNDYTLELTPHGNTIERRLVFYRSDGTDKNGGPKYEEFPSNELAAISALYPSGSMRQEGERHFAGASFSGAMPGDIGGAGSYTNMTTEFGSAAFYIERFRGNDDLAGQQAKRFAAADQLTDLILGWCKAEFKNEPGYKNLHRFMDVNVRRDLKNGALYFWAGDLASYYKADSDGEFVARFAQYLVERGYVKQADVPLLAQTILGKDDSAWALLVQRLVAAKLGIGPDGAMPQTLTSLADTRALSDSWTKFLAGTDAYRVRVKDWEKEKEQKPDAKKPEPTAVADDLLMALATSGSTGTDDHLAVKLVLPSAPDHTNGKWDEASKQVTWGTTLEARESAGRLPVVCYASWSQPDNQFQDTHFGRTILSGDSLLSYCVWRGRLNEAQAGKWEKFLAGLKPGGGLTNQLGGFEFAEGSGGNAAAAGYATDLIRSALSK